MQRGIEMFNIDEEIKIRDKHLFLDMDGTIAEYRSYNRINCSLEECFLKGLYINCRPLYSIIDCIKNAGCKEIYILSQVQSYIGIKEKVEWLHSYVPFIKDENMFFISESKPLALNAYVDMLKLKKEDVVIVDDTVNILEETENMGYLSYHVSSLVY